MSQGSPTKETADRESAAYRFLRQVTLFWNSNHPADEAIDDLKDMSPPNSTAFSHDESNQSAAQMIEFAQRILTPRRLAWVAKTATWDEFVTAGEDFRILREITAFVSQNKTFQQHLAKTPALKPFLIYNTLGWLGPIIIMGDIALHRAGYGDIIRSRLK